MRKAMKKTIVVIMCLVIAMSGSSVAYAASASNLKELAKEFTKHGLKRESSFDIKFTGSDDEVDAFFDDSEDLDFFFSTMSIQDDPTTSDDADYLIGTIDYSKGIYYEYDDGKFIFRDVNYFETLDQTDYVNKHVPKILDELGVESMTNYEKVKAIHDYVCRLITYKVGSDDSIFCMYGAIKNHQAVCNAYSLCMYKLLVEAGVPCKYIGGFAGTGKDAEGHAWNIVALGDKWYNLDATWDDDDDTGKIKYDYFLKGSSDFDDETEGEPHNPENAYKKAPFKDIFPIAKTKFNPKTMDSENYKITIGGTDPGDTTETKYKLSDLVEGKYPNSGKFSVKKNKKGELQLFITKDGADLIKKVSYKVTTGKSRIKSIKNYGLNVDDGEYFTALTFKGKKKGKVNIQIILKLHNGQTLKYTFKGKIK